MKFEELENKMRPFETAHDHCVLPEMHMVARIDGWNFTRLTKERHSFNAPYDEKFRDYMVATTEHLMQCGFRILYGYTQSDEISLLFHRNEDAFGRKLSKFHSILAAEASAKFSLLLDDVAAFDCRVAQFPNSDLVIDYFRWRSEDAARNSLNSYCYWTLRKEGQSANAATSTLRGLSVSDKHELLFQRDINFNDLPNWQKRGVGLCLETYAKEGVNPLTGARVSTERRRIRIDYSLPMKDDYDRYLRRVIESG